MRRLTKSTVRRGFPPPNPKLRRRASRLEIAAAVRCYARSRRTRWLGRPIPAIAFSLRALSPRDVNPSGIRRAVGRNHRWPGEAFDQESREAQDNEGQENHPPPHDWPLTQLSDRSRGTRQPIQRLIPAIATPMAANVAGEPTRAASGPTSKPPRKTAL